MDYNHGSISHVSFSAADEAMQIYTISGHCVCFSDLIHRSGTVVCYSSATASQNNLLFTKGNSPISRANGDSCLEVWVQQFIHNACDCKKSRNIPQSKQKSVTAFILTMFTLMNIQRNSNHWRRQNNWSNSSLTKNLLPFLKEYIRKQTKNPKILVLSLRNEMVNGEEEGKMRGLFHHQLHPSTVPFLLNLYKLKIFNLKY